MTQSVVLLIDDVARLVWIAGMQIALFGTALLVPMWMVRRRPASRHFLASTVLIAALASPLTAACSYWLGTGWVPVPAWLFLVERRTVPAAENSRSPTVTRIVAPPSELASSPLLEETPRLTPEDRRSRQIAGG